MEEQLAVAEKALASAVSDKQKERAKHLIFTHGHPDHIGN
jgi:glyoxylase-like metal-dependent hydrolase (beta-lactamase superfamily II)